MISNNTNRLSLADCVRLLDTPGADLSVVQDSIRQSAQKPMKDSNADLSSSNRAEFRNRCRDHIASLVKVPNELVDLRIPLRDVSSIVHTAAAVGKSIYKTLKSYENV